MRWFMELAYRGAPFHGWQIQPGAVSVQGCLESALSTMLRRPVAVTGAGRTDAGVNARYMAAHLDLPDEVDPRSDAFIRSVNGLAGPYIAVYGFRRVTAEAHARFDATERSYRYFVTTRKDPFGGRMVWNASPALDFDAMNRAAELIIGRGDFSSFAKLHSDTRTNICDIRRAAWHSIDDHHWYFEIAADRFLRNMVRAVVGTLVEVGRRKMLPGDITKVIARRDRCAAGTSMPPEPLFLWSVSYPASLFI